MKTTKLNYSPDQASQQLLPATTTDPSAVAKIKTAEHWAQIINGTLRRSATELIEAGKQLIAAKQALPHGEWQKMFDQRIIGLNLREAQRLMEVAGHPVFAKANNCSFLPPSAQALSALAKVDPATLEKALESGEITSQTTIAEAKQFQQANPAPGAATPKRTRAPKNFDIGNSARRSVKFLADEISRCPTADKATLLGELYLHIPLCLAKHYAKVYPVTDPDIAKEYSKVGEMQELVRSCSKVEILTSKPKS